MLMAAATPRPLPYTTAADDRRAAFGEFISSTIVDDTNLKFPTGRRCFSPQ
jgi:hypothetical protein